MTDILPISAIVPTRNRYKVFSRTLSSLAQQSAHPKEMIVVDASHDSATQELCKNPPPGLQTQIYYYPAIEVGAASQRNQAVTYATQDIIWLLDDDILLEPKCLSRLWNALHSNPKLGGVNAMITNQSYLPPGRISYQLFRWLDGKTRLSYAGLCIGPALNLLPEDHEKLPDIVPVEWLNSTCTLYRRQALPNPLFPPLFTGYSLMEDVCLSLIVGQQWQLANARTARIFHDSQPGDHKNSCKVLAQMELVNRHYVMTQVLERKKRQDYCKLFVLELFKVAASLQSLQGWFQLPGVLWGKLQGILQIMKSRSPFSQ